MIQSVEKLGIKTLLQCALLYPLLQAAAPAGWQQSRPALLQLLHAAGAEVAGQKDQAVAKVQCAVAGAEAQLAVVEDIHQRANDRVASFLQLVKQHEAGSAEAAFDGLAVEQGGAFLAADVAGWCASQGGCVVLLCQGVHVDPAQGIGLTVNRLGQQSHGFGFADAGRAEQEEHAEWFAWIAQLGLDHRQAVADFCEGIVLTDDALLQQLHDAQRLKQEAAGVGAGARRLLFVVLLVLGQQVIDKGHGVGPYRSGRGAVRAPRCGQSPASRSLPEWGSSPTGQSATPMVLRVMASTLSRAFSASMTQVR